MGCEVDDEIHYDQLNQNILQRLMNRKNRCEGEYYNNMKLSGKPVFTQIDSMINFNYGTNSPVPGVPEDQFSIRWKGKIIPPETIHQLVQVRMMAYGFMLMESW